MQYYGSFNKHHICQHIANKLSLSEFLSLLYFHLLSQLILIFQVNISLPSGNITVELCACSGDVIQKHALMICIVLEKHNKNFNKLWPNIGQKVSFHQYLDKVGKKQNVELLTLV